MTMLRRTLALPLLAVCTLAAPARAAESEAEPPSPRGFVEKQIKRAHKLASREIKPNTPAEEKWQADAKALIDEVIDWPELTEASLGKRWRELDAKQQARFSTLLRTLIETSYRSRLRSAVRSDEAKKARDETEVKIDWLDESVRRGKASLEAKVSSGKDTAMVGFKLRWVDGRWQIYDLSLDDVSTVRNYRSAFARIFDKDGFEGLTKRLEKKIEDIEAGRADFARAGDMKD